MWNEYIMRHPAHFDQSLGADAANLSRSNTFNHP
jgi:hypothetical protein